MRGQRSRTREARPTLAAPPLSRLKSRARAQHSKYSPVETSRRAPSGDRPLRVFIELTCSEFDPRRQAVASAMGGALRAMLVTRVGTCPTPFNSARDRRPTLLRTIRGCSSKSRPTSRAGPPAADVTSKRPSRDLPVRTSCDPAGPTRLSRRGSACYRTHEP